MVGDTNDAMAFGEQVVRSDRLRLRTVQEHELALLERWWNTESLLPHQTGNVVSRPDGGHLDEFRRWYANTDPAHVGFAVERLEDGELRVYAFNDRAIRCYRSAGFVEEGRRRQVVFLDGRWHDQLVMGIVRPDWQEAPRPS